MANVKITQLPQILPNQITNLDVLPIVDEINKVLI